MATQAQEHGPALKTKSPDSTLNNELHPIKKDFKCHNDQDVCSNIFHFDVWREVTCDLIAT